MVQVEFRILAKVVAVVELVWYSFELVGAIYVAFASLIFGADVPGVSNGKGFGELLIICIIAITLHVLQLYFSYQLFSATKPGLERTVALRWAQYWRIFCVVMLVLSAISLPFHFANFLLILFKIAFRLGCLFLVHYYIRELTFSRESTVTGGDFRSQQASGMV